MLLSAPLATVGAESRLPTPFPPLCAPPISCLMTSAGRHPLKPAAAAADPCRALYPATGYQHPGAAATSAALLQLGYPVAAPAPYPAQYPYTGYPAPAPRPPPPDVSPASASALAHPLFLPAFRPPARKEVVPPTAIRAAPPAAFRPLPEVGKDGVHRVPAHYPAVYAPAPPPPLTVGYSVAGTPPRSSVLPPQPAVPASSAVVYTGRSVSPRSTVPPQHTPPSASTAVTYSSLATSRHSNSSDDSAQTRLSRMRNSSGSSVEQIPPPVKRARVDIPRSRGSEVLRERSSNGCAANNVSEANTRAPSAEVGVGEVKGTEMPSAVSNDYYTPPEHFRLGSVIELADGRLKRVEDLRTEDFESSADQSAELRLDRSVVTRIDERGRTAQIVFAVGSQRMEVAVEAQLEHPFFVFHRGWSSCSPTRTLQLYGLPCLQLSIGDACVSLAPRPQAEVNHASNNHHNTANHNYNHAHVNHHGRSAQ